MANLMGTFLQLLIAVMSNVAQQCNYTLVHTTAFTILVFHAFPLLYENFRAPNSSVLIIYCTIYIEGGFFRKRNLIQERRLVNFMYAFLSCGG
jgi:hypothetical protein